MYEAKALTTASNSGAELVNVYDAVVQDSIFNDWVTLKLFGEESGSGIPHFKVRTGRNTQSTYYGENDPIVTGQTGKVDVRFYWKLYKAPVEVTGLEIESAKATGGELADIYNYELRKSVEDMTNNMNSDIHSTGTEASGGGALTGLKRIVDDGSNYATFYGITRDASNWVSGGYNATSEALSLSLMRTMKRTCEQNGANTSNLRFVTSFKQRDKYLDLLQDLQRLTPMVNVAGFGQVPSFDGIPIIADKECDDDYMYCLEVSTFKRRTLLKPTVKPLPSQKDAEAGFARTYLEVICKQPNLSFKKINLT